MYQGTCGICKWSGRQGGWTTIRTPAPKDGFMMLLCHRCSLFWHSIVHQIDCGSCRQCRKGGQYNPASLLESLQRKNT